MSRTTKVMAGVAVAGWAFGLGLALASGFGTAGFLIGCGLMTANSLNLINHLGDDL